MGMTASKLGREGLEECFDFIDRATDEEKPFFMWYAPFLPHTRIIPRSVFWKNTKGIIHLPWPSITP